MAAKCSLGFKFESQFFCEEEFVIDPSAKERFDSTRGVSSRSRLPSRNFSKTHPLFPFFSFFFLTFLLSFPLWLSKPQRLNRFNIARLESMSSQPHESEGDFSTSNDRPGLAGLALKEDRQRRASLTDATTVVGTPTESEKQRDGSIDFSKDPQAAAETSGAKPLTGVRLVLLMIAMLLVEFLVGLEQTSESSLSFLCTSLIY